MTRHERWLASAWTLVSANLPPSPATVVELGCGSLGGFVPMLRAAGYDAVGVDPEAPDGEGYRQVGFEQFSPDTPVDAVVASLSLHHVADLGAALDRVVGMLNPAGTVVVLEWAWERFDEATARWCFERLPPADDEPDWLHRHEQEWRESGQPWESYLTSWADHDMHTGDTVLGELADRFDRILLEQGPLYFASLDGVTEADEMAAIEAGLIQAGQVRFVGRLPSR
jgi:SAM-dependent methyltransferase